MTPPDPAQWLRLGQFVLSPLTRELRDAHGDTGRVINVEPTLFDVLVFLVERRDRVCSREEILGACWPDASVSQSALDSAIKRLRRVLGDDGNRQEWITTVRGRGYRYVGEATHESRQVDETPGLVEAGARIVICDDHAIFRAGLRSILDITGAEVFEASNTDETFALLAAVPDVDVVLLDVEMPEDDGWAALLRLRKDHSSTPAIIVSARKDPAVIERALAEGASGYIPKSTSPEIFRAAVQRVLQGGTYAPPTPTTFEASTVPQSRNKAG